MVRVGALFNYSAYDILSEFFLTRLQFGSLIFLPLVVLDVFAQNLLFLHIWTFFLLELFVIVNESFLKFIEGLFYLFWQFIELFFI